MIRQNVINLKNRLKFAIVSIVFFAIVASALGVPFSIASAETDFSFQKKQEIVESLKAQIAELVVQIAELTQQLTVLQGETVPEVQAQVLFSAPLFLGMRNEEVRKLQEILAQDPEIYPEGLVTGYFGLLTHTAVVRFQEKYADEILEPIGLPAGTGFVGERTLTKLNELYAASTAQEEPASKEQAGEEEPQPLVEEEIIPSEGPVVEEKEADETPLPPTGGGGGDGDSPPPAADTTAPVAIDDLAASSPTTSSITLSWTAPGDDGTTGTAASYDVRYATSTITDANWSDATQAIGAPTPQVAGSSETFTVSGLSSGTTYYFAIKASDEVPNESALSNVASGTTSTPPPPPPQECSAIASGKQTYFVSTPNMPQIMQVDFDPLDVAVGAAQIVTVKVRDTNDNAISLVTGSVQIDNGSDSFSLFLIAGTNLDGTWEGTWTPTDTFCTTYTTTITATSASGTSKVDVSFR